MRQIVQLDEQTQKEVATLEQKCEQLVNKLNKQYACKQINIVIELVRCRKGKLVSNHEIFTEDYESFLEIGIEEEEDYYPNDYIPIWKCKQELFHKVGYLTDDSIKLIEEKLHCLVQELLMD
ncbi:hypothetical protein J2S17_005650 [Cytobacillus purgationiresistens]|uniref:Uncharacterized protein n=1 Tax=Cytobacillus purgationiresistens TaxID=863449 RepID=A0ABU0AR10_9BACI|nr:hypothetical protein [Cytobacillus purgationiresistens]